MEDIKETARNARIEHQREAANWRAAAAHATEVLRLLETLEEDAAEYETTESESRDGYTEVRVRAYYDPEDLPREALGSDIPLEIMAKRSTQGETPDVLVIARFRV